MKRIIALALVLSAIPGFASCSSKNSLSEPPTETMNISQTMYKMEKMSFPENFSGLTDIAYIADVGVRMIYRDTNSAFRVAIYDDNFQCVSDSELEGDFPENSDLSCFVSPDGITHILIRSVEFDKSLMPSEDEQDQKAWEKYIATGVVTMTVSSYDENFRLLQSTVIEDDSCFSYADHHFVSGFAPCGENYLITTDEAMVLVDKSGRIIDTGQFNLGDIYTCDSNGQLLCCDNKGYAVISPDEPFSIPGELTPYADGKSMNGADTGALGYTMFFYLSDGFYGMSADGDMVKLIDYLRSNISGSEVQTITPVDEGKFILYNAGSKGQSLCALTVRPDDYVPSQEKVLVGRYDGGYNFDIADAAAEYNRYNDKYTVDVKNYTDTDSLRNDILSGESPDFLIYSDYDIMPRFVNLGSFADMYQLYDEYGGISPDEMMPNVVEAFTYKGGLYTMCTEFNVKAYFADKEVVAPEHSRWSMEEFLDIAEALPDDMYLGSRWDFGNSEHVYFFLIQNNLNNWVDYERNTCSFDSDEFIRALRLCKNANLAGLFDLTGMSEEEINAITLENAHSIKEHKAMLFAADYSGTMEDFLMHTAQYGYSPFELTMLNTPNRAGAGCMAPTNGNLFSVMQGGSCTAGGWDFANYLMSEDHQYDDYATSFPSNAKAFEKTIKYSQKNMAKSGTSHAGFNNYTVSFNCDLSDEQVRYLTDFIKNCSVFAGENKTISDMIREGFDSFINGEISAEECADMLQDRVSLYFSENA
ncbi:MAG: carbohydrate ABC transporter substrate-binding protein [Ruminococcus sp.]|nr:carbohydrate ABC transporter substrate-binding protein [Ruminococcus sp.]